MKKRIVRILLFISMLTSTMVSAQCPVISVGIPDSVCINESFDITNNSNLSDEFEWDFCSRDLDTELSLSSLGLNASLSLPLDISIVQDNGNWFGFVPSEGTNIIYRYDFGTNINNPPTIVSLGNIGGLLDEPEVIRTVQESGNWYGLVVNGSGTVVRVDFGSNLDNNSPTSEIVFNAGANNSGLGIFRDSDQVIVFVTNITYVIRADFGNSIANNPGQSEIDTLDVFTGASGLNGISLVRDCDNWYGVFSAIFSKQLFYADFGNSPLNTPVIEVINHGVTLGNPTQLKLIRDYETYFLFLASRNGTIFRANFGQDLSDPGFNFSDLGDFGSLANTQAFAHVDDSSNHHFFTIDFTSKELFRLDAVNSCTSSQSFTTDFAPMGLSYPSAGTYYIESIATNAQGLETYHVDSVVVVPDPMAGFTTNLVCENGPTSFTDSSTDFGRNISTWAWDFGDPGSGVNNTSNLQNPTHNYTTAGDYNVSLTVTNECGRMANTLIPVTVFSANDLQAEFNTTGNLCVGNSITFNDQSTFTDDIPQSWSWDFSGQGVSTQQNPSFTFLAAGDYMVSLTTTGLSGCEKTIQKSVSISPGPTSAFTASSFNVCQGETIAFTNQSTGSPVSFDWNFGDSFTSTTENPSHLFATAGNFDVSLMTTDALGCENTLVREVSVSALPVVSFDFDVPCTSVEGIQFTDLSTVDGADIVSRTWFVDNVEVSSLQNPSIVFESEGTVNVRLETLSSNGCEASYNEDISVLNSPQPSFSIDLGCQGETSTFVDITSSPGNPIISWLWDVNGTSYTNEVVNHTFLSPGIFDVTLEVTAQNFCSETFTRSVEILELPSLNFSVVGDCSNEIIQLEDQSTIFQDPIVSREWRLNGSAVGNGSELFLSELQDDTYDLQLEVVTQSGCITNASQELVISTAPMASISASKTFGIPGDQILFTDNSLESSEKQWLLNGELLSNEGSTQSLTFPDPGIHRVSVVANNSLGCSDTSTADILIAIPEVDLSIGQFDLIENGNSGSIFLEIENNSNLPVEVTEVVIELENQFSITEQVLAPIGINESQLVNLNVGIPLTNSELTYLCISLNSQYTDYLDLTPIDNEKCIALEPEVVVEAPFPNPTSGQSRVRVIVPEPSEAIMTLLNPSGKVETSSFQNLNPGLNNFFFDLQDLESGIYLVKVEVLGRISIQRIIKL